MRTATMARATVLSGDSVLTSRLVLPVDALRFGFMGARISFSLQMLMRRFFGLRRWVPTLRNPYPLSDLDGLNVWYEARMLEEGIEDMQNLVTANIVDVLLRTQVPVGRLGDWIDQAHLYVFLDPTEDDG